MFSPISQISTPSSPFLSLSSFISSFTCFHHFGVFNTTILFQLNLGLSMDSTAFIISLISTFPLHFLCFRFIPPNISYNSLSSLPSSIFTGLSSLTYLRSFSIPLSSPLSSRLSHFLSTTTVWSHFLLVSSLTNTVFLPSSFFLHSILTNLHITLLFTFFPTVCPPFLQVFLKVLTTWFLFPFLFPSLPHFHLHLIFISQ